MIKIFGKYWNKVIINFIIALMMLIIIIGQWVMGREFYIAPALIGMITGLLIINGFAWWKIGNE